MEEDINMDCKRTKLDVENDENKTVATNAASSFSNDIEMKDSDSKSKETEGTDVKEDDTTENNVSKENVLDETRNRKRIRSRSPDGTDNTTEENLNVKTERKISKDETTNEVDSNHNDELKDIPSTSNTVEQEVEAGPSEYDTVRKPRNRNRHYRPRRISSSDSSEIDDMDVNEENVSEPNDHNDSDQNTNDRESHSTIDSDDAHSIDLTMSSSGSSFQVDHLESNDSDDDEGGEDDAVSEEVNSIQEMLAREKPKYQTNLFYEIMCREHGLTTKRRGFQRHCGPLIFQNNICSSRLTVEKLRILHNLRKHRGCVNSLNFNRKGDILCSGSDDLKIILWDWCNNKMLHSFTSGHRLNVFQTKFTNIGEGMNIVSSARDGEVRHQIIPPSGSKNISTVLFKHSLAVHKIVTCPTNPYEILTAGEDGSVVRCDLREKPIENLVTVRGKNSRKINLYSIAHNPLDQEFCVCGRDRFVRVYDKRNVKKPTVLMCPQKFMNEKKDHYNYITCAVYNQTGTEILASYNESYIYLFNNKVYLEGHFTHSYKGHLNFKTIKGVNFYGPNSEYVISGSDCGNMFIWDKETEVIVNWQKGDRKGILNCLEPHPCFPILATSGLDSDVKIWSPIAESPVADMEGLEKCVKKNTKSLVTNENDFLNTRTFLFFVSRLRGNRSARNRNESSDFPYVEDLASSSSDGRHSDLDDDDDDVRVPCTTQ